MGIFWSMVDVCSVPTLGRLLAWCDLYNGTPRASINKRGMNLLVAVGGAARKSSLRGVIIAERRMMIDVKFYDHHHHHPSSSFLYQLQLEDLFLE
jgi:hypothetical protein